MKEINEFTKWLDTFLQEKGSTLKTLLPCKDKVAATS